MPPDEPALTNVVGMAYDAVTDPTLWEPFLRALAVLFHAESAAVVVHETGPEMHLLAATWMLDPQESRRYEKYYGRVDVWAMRGWSRSAGNVCTSESLCASQELVRTEFYNDFLVNQGIAHGLFGFIEKDPSRRCGNVSLYRSPSSEEFQASHIGILNLLIPHLQRAFMLHSGFSKLKARAGAIETALNMLAVGVIFIGPDGEMVLVNSKAEELLRHGDGLRLVHSRLSADLHVEASRLQALISGAMQTSNGKGLSTGGTILISRKSGRPLSVTVAPLRNLTVGIGQQPCAILFVSDPEQNVELPADLLCRCYRLTMAEARLTMLLLEGHSLKETADLCGVTYNTAKSQLKSIFSKTQVQRQSELVKLLMSASRQA